HLSDRVALLLGGRLVEGHVHPGQRHSGTRFLVPLAAEIARGPDDLVGDVHVAPVAALPELVHDVELAHVLVGRRAEVARTEQRAGAAFDRVGGHVVRRRFVGRSPGPEDGGESDHRQDAKQLSHISPSLLTVILIPNHSLRQAPVRRLVLGSCPSTEGRSMKRWSIAVVFLALASGAAGQNPLPGQHNFPFAVDGVSIAGVVGFRIEFAPNTVNPALPERLDKSYLPVQRALYVTVTQKGLNQLQDWINSVTTVPPSATRTVSVASREAAGAAPAGT